MHSADKRGGTISARCALLLVIGFLISCYLLYHHVEVNGGFRSEPSICNFNSNFNCDAVARSSFAELFGLPVASLGIVYYFFFLAFVALYRRRESSADKRAYADSLFFLSLISLPETLYLLSASVFVLKTVCPFCALTYLINFLLCWVCGSSKERSSGLLASASSGFLSVARGVLGIRPFGTLNSSLILWLCVVTTAFCALQAPSILEKSVFEKRASVEALLPFIEAWESNEGQDLPVELDLSPLEKDFAIGAAQPTLTIVEFSDFQCPHCKRAAAHMKKIVEAHPDRVRVVFKNFPLDNTCNSLLSDPFHLFACQAAIMVRCAGLISDTAFWTMHDGLFEFESSDWELERLLTLPDELGLDTDSIMSCMSRVDIQQRVEQDVEIGISAGVQGTPAIFANGKRLEFDSFKQLPAIVDLILRRQ
jgi:protein-disulfide isomerase/uncharacterized membrane protein